MLTALRILNIVIWSGLFVFMFVGARSAVTGKGVRLGDPWRLSVASVSVLMILGNLRWLLAPKSEDLLAAISVLGIIVGSFKLYLARLYGRGPRL